MQGRLCNTTFGHSVHAGAATMVHMLRKLLENPHAKQCQTLIETIATHCVQKPFGTSANPLACVHSYTNLMLLMANSLLDGFGDKCLIHRVPILSVNEGNSAQASNIFAQVKQTIAAQRQSVGIDEGQPVQGSLEHADLLLAQVDIYQMMYMLQ